MTDRTPSSQQSSSAMSPVERIVDLALFAPFALSADLIQEIPAALTRARRQLQLAEFIGKLTVKQGTEQLRRRLDTARPSSESNEDPTGGRVAGDLVTDATVADVSAGPSGPVAADLALPDYEHLPAAHVVSKLATLSPADVDLIEQYERAHRHRRTVLGKIDQLRAASS